MVRGPLIAYGRAMLIAASAFAPAAHSAGAPCPPVSLSIDGDSPQSVACEVRPQGGKHGDLFSSDFATGTSSSIFNVAWGDKVPAVIADSSAPSGRSLRFDWDTGFENYNGVFKTVAGTHKKLYVRVLLKQGTGGSNGGIQKIIRFRPQINGAEAAAGTINFQWNNILFFGDSYGDGANHTQTDANTHGPNTFVGRWRYLEAMLDYSNPSVQHIAAWVDGTKVLDNKINLRTAMPSSLNMNGVMFLGTFNGPASDRFDYLGKVDISTTYMGVP